MVKDLHIAKNLEELESLASSGIPQCSKERLVPCLETLVKAVEKSSKEKDEEQEFIYLSKYFELITRIYKEKKGKGPDGVAKHYELAKRFLERYNSIKESLKKRYKVRTPISNDTNENSITVENQNPVSTPPSPASPVPIVPYISSRDLIQLMNSPDSILIIDIRPAKDYNESRIIYEQQLNIAQEWITGHAGISLTRLSMEIKDHKSIQLWDQRQTFHLVVLVDWYSTEINMTTSTDKQPLGTMFRLLTEFDQNNCKNVKFLHAGYGDFIDRYPHLSTKPTVEQPTSGSLLVRNISDLSYPVIFDEVEEQEERIPDESFPLIIDASTKPKRKPSKKSTEPKPKVPPPQKVKLDSQSYVSPCGNRRFEVGSSWNFSAPDSPIGTDLEELRKQKPQIPQGPPMGDLIEDMEKSSTVHDISMEVERVPLKKGPKPSTPTSGILKRSSSSPNLAKPEDEPAKPLFSRENKPLQTQNKQLPFGRVPQISSYGEHSDYTYGETIAGLTGLKNFANNCYMNSIIQCLSNTQPLVSDLLDIHGFDERPIINPASKMHGRIFHEVKSAFQMMWSGSVKVYTIKELKNIMGNFKEIFRGSEHQDSNEFLIILLEYLHEDLNMPSEITNLDGSDVDSGERAWGEFRKKNSSVVQRLFYGQHKSTVTCSSCGHMSATYEQFFNLFVPIPTGQDCNLGDCLKLYMSGENITGWKCPQCNGERNAVKKIEISKLPPILVIALKRFTQDGNSWLNKKENHVNYPINQMSMTPYVVRGSEQRYSTYNLYAMSIHTGTLKHGHYRAVCQNYQNHNWYMFDDTSINPLPQSSVYDYNREVYIFFYCAEKRDS